MTEREKLIELMTQAENEELSLLEFEKKILADYLLANGVIVLPVKVGDTVYNIDGECVSDSVVIECKIDECATGFKAQTYYGEEIDFDDYEIGKCIFLTREEEKKALKERQTNENT